jgi:hypothetical protein
MTWFVVARLEKHDFLACSDPLVSLIQQSLSAKTHQLGSSLLPKWLGIPGVQRVRGCDESHVQQTTVSNERRERRQRANIE